MFFVYLFVNVVICITFVVLYILGPLCIMTTNSALGTYRAIYEQNYPIEAQLLRKVQCLLTEAFAMVFGKVFGKVCGKVFGKKCS